MVRTSAAAGAGLVAGFVFGLMLDMAIGIGGMASGGEPAGFKFLPVGTAAVGALVAVVLYRLGRRRSR
ncbi:DUF5957 family protein [Phytohabitans flavus]|uniref:DUF5957 family protein n=1 Tax=Phytohabitans flavus TaxID=1076124 RepID=UPI001564E202|nr:DUF5957 family protein [Phytohabitans flavus]